MSEFVFDVNSPFYPAGYICEHKHLEMEMLKVLWSGDDGQIQKFVEEHPQTARTPLTFCNYCCVGQRSRSFIFPLIFIAVSPRSKVILVSPTFANWITQEGFVPEAPNLVDIPSY